ncbi:MAG: hypothetical protein IH987_16530 [Planctomycetes bacterium]|nr:hypothetical protein [Planctomycetota bacterium]
MMLSAIRWLVVDTIHHRTGVPRPQWDVSKLPTSVSAFETFVEHHYKHYLYYANMTIALGIVAAWPPLYATFAAVQPALLGAGVGVLMLLHFVASRDALRKYYVRTNALLSEASNDRLV